MKQNIYDDPRFFEGYSQLRRHESGLNMAVDQPAMRSLMAVLTSPTSTSSLSRAPIPIPHSCRQICWPAFLLRVTLSY